MSATEKLNPLPDDNNLDFEGESNAYVTEKKCSRDFVLWKKSKEDEIGWENPFDPHIGKLELF